LDIFSGRISSVAFTSGDRIVIGDWSDSHLGGFTNIMWARPDGSRVLLSPTREHADYVSKLYSFEDVRIVEIMVRRGNREVSVEADELSVYMQWGRSFPLPFWRPRWFIATVEKAFGRILFGTTTSGKTNDGRAEWYCVKGISRVFNSEASLGKIDLGKMVDFDIDACFGFSEPPKKPSSIVVKTYIQ